jgi:hypothetical protein
MCDADVACKGIILVPRESTPSFLGAAAVESGRYSSTASSGNDNWQSLVAYLSDGCQEPASDGSRWPMLKSLCGRVWEPKRSSYSSGVMRMPGKPAATELIQASVRMRDWEFFERAVENTSGGFDFELFKWIKGQLANGLSFTEAQNAYRSRPGLLADEHR